MPYTLLQTLNYLAATNRTYFASEPTRIQHANPQRPQQGTRCRLVTCHRKADRDTRLLVFKTTGPGKKIGGLRNLPCGQGGCWVCGKLLDLYVKDMEDTCPSLIAENSKKDSLKKEFVGESYVLEAEE